MMVMMHLLKVIIQKAIEDWVCAAGGDSNEMEDQVDLASNVDK